MLARASILLVFLLGMTGCSYVYDVTAAVIDGRLAFTAEWRTLFREHCVTEIAVVADDREHRAHAEPRDDKVRVGYGTYWRVRVGYECENTFPIFYGQQLQGETLPQEQQSGEVAPKPLKRNILYRVETVSGATGYGSGRFMIRTDGRVENFPNP